MLRIQRIISAANPLLRDVRRAVSRGERTRGENLDGLCIAEGFHLLEEALRSGRETAIVLASETAEAKVERAVEGSAVARLVVIPDPLFATIATTETSQGVIALVRPAEWTMTQIFRGGESGAEKSLVVVLDGIQDPGNAGAIVRAAEAFGATGVVFLKGTASPWHAKTIRASAGSLFRIPFAGALDAAAVRAELLRRHVAVYAAMPWREAQNSVDEADFLRPCAIIAGSEGRGVNPDLLAIAEQIAIPTAGVESLNTSVAAAVLLYEVRRQRGFSEPSS